jgi:hypothetical protein
MQNRFFLKTLPQLTLKNRYIKRLNINPILPFQAFLSMQHPASQPVINPATIDNSLLEEYVAPRFLRKMKSKVSST